MKTSRRRRNTTFTTPIPLVDYANLSIADNVDLMGSSEAELRDLSTRLEKASEAYWMEVSSERSKFMVDSSSQTAATNIMLNGQRLEEVDNFRLDIVIVILFRKHKYVVIHRDYYIIMRYMLPWMSP